MTQWERLMFWRFRFIRRQPDGTCLDRWFSFFSWRDWRAVLRLLWVRDVSEEKFVKQWIAGFEKRHGIKLPEDAKEALRNQAADLDKRFPPNRELRG